MIYFIREDTKVIMKMDTHLLGVEERIIAFTKECGDEIYAELLAEHLNEVVKHYEEHVAMNATNYLNFEQLAKLRKKIKELGIGRVRGV